MIISYKLLPDMGLIQIIIILLQWNHFALFYVIQQVEFIGLDVLIVRKIETLNGEYGRYSFLT